MTWTYSGDPATNARDSIRFLVGDTDTNDQLVSDEEIAWTNSEVTGSGTATTDLYTVAYRVMIAIASKFSRLANQAIGDMRVDLSQKADNARKQAEELRALADRVDPFFTSGQFANTSDYGASSARAYPGDDSQLDS